MNIVIIGQNERENMPKMLESLRYFFPCDKRIWVLDRSTDGSEEYLTEQCEFFVRTDRLELKGRCVSTARNFGLSFCDKNEDVLFLDGDRFILWCDKPFETFEKDCVLVMVEKDERDDPKWFTDYSQIYGHLHNGFYSCGLYMKRSAIDKVLDFQGELFSTDIERYWGVEDVHLGDVCYHLGLTCTIHDSMRLYGSFNSEAKIPLDAWRERIKKRLLLNVIW